MATIGRSRRSSRLSSLSGSLAARFGLVQHFLREDVGNAVLVDRDQAEAARAPADRRAPRSPSRRRCGRARPVRPAPAGLPRPRPDRRSARNCGCACRPARASALPAAVDLDHAQHLVFGATASFFIGCAQPAAARFLGAGEHAVARSAAPRRFFFSITPQARRRRCRRRAASCREWRWVRHRRCRPLAAR